MAFDINIVDTISGRILDTDSISYNWGDLSDICTEHLDATHCNHFCMREHLWYCRSDLGMKTGNDVADNCATAIAYLAQRGIIAKAGDDKLNDQWGYGIKALGGKLPAEERLAIFSWHLTRLMRKGLLYKTAVFIHD